jgi:hypothetical protein
MGSRFRKTGSTRSVSETLLWAWVLAVAIGTVIGAVVLFFFFLRG